MKRARESYPGFQMGTSLLLVVLTSLCLLILSAMSLSAAIRDYGYSEKIAEKTKAYYEANSKANHTIKNLITSGEEGLHSFEIAINDARLLTVTVNIYEDSYEILKWKEISSDTWEHDDRLPVLGSDQEE